MYNFSAQSIIICGIAVAATLLVPVKADAREKKASHHYHSDHSHVHGPGCGHPAIYHNGHIDYLHDGHLHHRTADGRVEEHSIPISERTPRGHTGKTGLQPTAASQLIRHGDHYDYLVNGRLSHSHGDHYDDHGSVQVIEPQLGGAPHNNDNNNYQIPQSGQNNPCYNPCVPLCY